MSRLTTDDRVDARSIVKANYPAPTGNRRKDTRQRTVGPTGKVELVDTTRAQLAKRRAPMGQPTEAELRSRKAGTYQAKPTKAVGRAQRPATRLPTADPAHGTPLPPSQRHPQLSGRTFSDRGTPTGGGAFAERFFR